MAPKAKCKTTDLARSVTFMMLPSATFFIIIITIIIIITDFRNIDLLFHLLMHSLVDSWMCPDQGLNLQRWHIKTML